MTLFDLPPSAILLRLALGAGIGFCVGLSGVGGGVLGLQATTLALGLDPIRAVGTTSLYLFLTTITASFQHIRLRNVAWRSAWPILCGALPANIGVAAWISRQGSNETFKTTLEQFILFVVFVAIAAMAINMLRNATKPETHMPDRCIKRTVISFLVGVVFGGLIGATSVGGGILLVPTLMLLGLSSRQTVGSAIFITMLLTCVTAVVYGMGGEVDRVTALVMAAGALFGVWRGSLLSTRFSEGMLKKVMLGLVFAVALAMLFSRGS